MALRLVVAPTVQVADEPDVAERARKRQGTRSDLTSATTDAQVEKRTPQHVNGDGRLYRPGETITADADTDTCARFAEAILAGHVEVHSGKERR